MIATSSAAVSTGSKARRPRAPGASSSSVSSRAAPAAGARLLHLAASRASTSACVTCAFVDHLRELAGAQQRHRRHDDPAGQQDAEPARRSPRACSAPCSSTRLPGTIASAPRRADPPRARAARRSSTPPRDRRTPSWRRAARPPRSAAPGTARAAVRSGQARAAAGGRGRTCRIHVAASLPRAMIELLHLGRALVDPQRADLAVQALDRVPGVTPSPPNSWTAASITRWAASVACSLAIAASRVTRPPRRPSSRPRDRRAARWRRRRAPCRRAWPGPAAARPSARRTARACVTRPSASSSARRAMPERRGADRGAEDVERARARSASPRPARRAARRRRRRRSAASPAGAARSRRSARRSRRLGVGVDEVRA